MRGAQQVLIAALTSFTLGGVIVWCSMPIGAGLVGLGVCLLAAVVWTSCYRRQ
jgi:hypothetical protein